MLWDRASDSGTTIGTVTQRAGPFSVVVELVNGQSTGAKGWGGGDDILDQFRIDPFQNIANAGESFTISAITFGSQLTEIVPEPATLVLAGIGGLMLMCRRRA